MTSADRDAAHRADVEWIGSLSGTLRDAEYAAILDYLLNLDLEIFPPGTTAESIAAFAGLGNDSVLLSVVDMAMQNVDLSAYGYNSTTILVCFSAIPTVNGFCLKTPNLGSPAIVLNHGLIAYIAYAAHLTLGITRWSGTKYCNHYSLEVIIESLFRLAEGIAAKKPALLLGIEATGCLDEHSHDSSQTLHEVMCWISELFIILHELGHIALGHLNPADVTYAFGDEIGESLPVFNRSQLQEFAADKFAFNRLVEICVKPEGLLKKDVAYNIGCLLILMRTVEVVSSHWASETHPSANLRWQALKREVGDVVGPAALDSVDYFFEWIDRFRLGKDADNNDSKPDR